jgi:cytochrome P450
VSPEEIADDRPHVEFDHHSREFGDTSWSIFADLRERCPVSWSDNYGGFWILANYDDVRTVALDDATFSSAQSITVPAKPPTARLSIPIEMDPPRFLEYRRMLNPRFAPAAIDKLESTIRGFVDQLIDEFVERGECDLVLDFTNPLPAMTTLHLLGLPVEDWEAYAVPLHDKTFMRNHSPEQIEQYEGVHKRVLDAIADRRATPRDDMISYLLAQEVGGAPISDAEVLDMVMLTLHGGFDTTGSAIGNAMLFLDQHHGHRDELIAKPELRTSAVEEFLRYEAPQQGLARVATRDVEIGDQCIREGDRVFLLWASATRDDQAFPSPDEVQLDRFPNRHMTFGVGAHRCLGSTIARRQILCALDGLLTRIPDFVVDRDRIVRADTVGVVFGHYSIPVRFTPGPRAGAQPATMG